MKIMVIFNINGVFPNSAVGSYKTAFSVFRSPPQLKLCFFIHSVLFLQSCSVHVFSHSFSVSKILIQNREGKKKNSPIYSLKQNLLSTAGFTLTILFSFSAPL